MGKPGTVAFLQLVSRFNHSEVLEQSPILQCYPFPTVASQKHLGPHKQGSDNTSRLPSRYLHNGAELCFVLHLLVSYASLDTRQNAGLEEVPPVVMKDPEKQLKQFSFHIGRGSLGDKGKARRESPHAHRQNGSHYQHSPRRMVREGGVCYVAEGSSHGLVLQLHTL